MRIDFGVSDVKLVLLDGISNNGSDIARLQAFDSTNTILGTYTTAALALVSSRQCLRLRQATLLSSPKA